MQLDDEQDPEEQENQAVSRADSKDTTDAGESESTSSYVWFSLIDAVSETVREPWNNVWKMNIYEFFNILSYREEKYKRQADMLKKYKHSK